MAMVGTAISAALIVGALLAVLLTQLDVGRPKSADELSADLLQASANNDLDAARKALEAGADVNWHQGGTGKTALHVAVARRMSALLLVAGAEVNARDAHGVTPLHQAAAINSIDILALLLEYDAGVDAQDDSGATPLHFAALANATATAAILLEVGADVNARDHSGATPLHEAIVNGMTSIAELLRQHGGVE